MNDTPAENAFDLRRAAQTRLAPGSHRARIADVAVEDRSGREPVLTVFLEILDFEHGRTLADRFAFGERAGARSRAFRIALGLQQNEFNPRLAPLRFIGQVLEVDVEPVEAPGGRTTMVIRDYRPLSEH